MKRWAKVLLVILTVVITLLVIVGYFAFKIGLVASGSINKPYSFCNSIINKLDENPELLLSEDTLKKLDSIILVLDSLETEYDNNWTYRLTKAQCLVCRGNHRSNYYQLNLALEDFRKSRDLMKIKAPLNLHLIPYADLHNLIATVLQLKGDFTQSIDNLRIALEIYKLKENTQRQAIVHANMALSHTQNNDPEKALLHINTAIQLWNSITLNHRDSTNLFATKRLEAVAYIIKGKNEETIGKFKESKQYLDKAALILDNMIQMESYFRSEEKEQLTAIYTDALEAKVLLGKEDDIEQLATKNLILLKEMDLTAVRGKLGYTKALQGLVAAKNGDFESAFEYINSAFLTHGIPITNFWGEVDGGLEKVKDKLPFLKTLKIKNQVAELYQQKKKQDTQSLQKLLYIQQYAASVLDSIRLGLSLDASVSAIGASSVEFYYAAAWTAFELYKKEGNKEAIQTVLNFSEKSKGYVLNQAINRRVKGKSYSGKMKDLFEVDNIFRENILMLEQRALVENNREKRISILDSLLQVKLVFATHLKALEKAPAGDSALFYLDIIDNRPPILEEIQNDLIDQDQALVSYILHKGKALVIIITRSCVKILELSLNNCNDWYSSWRKFETGIKEDIAVDSTSLAACCMYKHFFQEVDQHIQSCNSGIKRVLIVPDNELRAIPFEAMLVKDPLSNSNNRPYFLINDYSIGYTYSIRTGLLSKIRNSSPLVSQQKSFGCFIASYTNADGYITCMPFNKENLENLGTAAENIAQIFDHTPFQDATKQEFIEHAPTYVIVHLSGHGDASDSVQSNPLDYSLIFSPDSNTEDGNCRLTLAEINRLKLNAELLVTGNCSTQQGKNQRGEGVPSLARSLLVAGSESILATLNTIVEKPNDRILLLFYQNLRNGTPKDVALARAKREIINESFSGQDRQYQRPFYWAKTILIGNQDPISFSLN